VKKNFSKFSILALFTLFTSAFTSPLLASNQQEDEERSLEEIAFSAIQRAGHIAPNLSKQSDRQTFLNALVTVDNIQKYGNNWKVISGEGWEKILKSQQDGKIHDMFNFDEATGKSTVSYFFPDPTDETNIILALELEYIGNFQR